MGEKLKKRFIISGGGSGGHVFPALAIADALQQQIPEAEILFVGAKGKLEMTKVPQAGYTIEGLWISGLQRSLTWRNVLFPIKLLSSLVRSWKIVRSFKPDVAIGVGGYASAPLLRMAAFCKIPTLIQEQNSYAGLTNRWLAGVVDRICVAYPGMERFFPKEKIVRTGNPIRSDLMEGDRSTGMNHFSLELRKKTILVTGGSLGARTLNDALRASRDMIAANESIQWIWQSGSLYYEEFKDCETAQLLNVQVHPFLDRMDLAYAAADLVVCRAGAVTISELSALHLPAVLVPSPNVSEDHQTSNARTLMSEGAAIMIADSQCKDDLVATCLKVIHDEDRLKELSDRISTFEVRDATNRIVEEVLAL
ncbi:MAG: undecaprenyldiphospho-muramoylpentapeptide beta-N-acetylglucosaminyltransferase [Saprospiraceae bacterium]|nr:undecaprenyldiphospho-muramoylpentapeptide beta-N-acetylglucosaminyltransferase [Saprospiraceae bacterium]